MANGKKRQAQQETLEVEQFSIVQGMNTQELRAAIGQGFWSWLMNFQPIGKHTLRALPGKGANIYTLGGGDTIVSGRIFILGTTTYYAALFTLNGAGYQVNLSNGAVTTIGAAATFYSGTGQYPACVNWGNNGIVIVSPAGYWAWDGTTLFSAGGAAPTWLYPVGASVTIMPTGISGTAIEIYNATVWLINGRVIQAAAPGSGNDFATSDGAVNVTVKDGYIQDGYSAIKQLDGFLYLFAHPAVDVISDVQTSGSPPTTTFLRVNVSPIIGTAWRDSVAQLPSSLVFANATGAYEVSGGQVRKVSDAFDGIFSQATYPAAATDPSGFHPSACAINLNETTCYALTINLPDPDDATNTFVPCLAVWDGRRWFLASQESSVEVLLGQDNDSVLSAWGSTGTTLFPAFSLASATLTKKAKSWFSEGKSGVTMRKEIQRVYAQFGDTTAGVPLSTFNVDTESGSVAAASLQPPSVIWLNNTGGIVQWQNVSAQNIFWTTAFPLIIGGVANAIALIFGVTIASVRTTLDVLGLYVGYVDYSRYE
jgi:hypothetical protein